MSNDPSEDLIEATIRRVAEAKAAREATKQAQAPVHADVAEAEETPPATGEVGIPEETAPLQEPPSGEPPSLRGAAPVDEDLIEATIRRVAAARAAKEAEQPAAPPAAEAPAEASPARLRALPPTAEPAATTAPEGEGRWAMELRNLQQEVVAMQGMLRELQARVDAALAIAGASDARTAPPVDDDWEDTPSLPRIPLGQPPRPAILRDPPARPASAERLAEPEPGDAVIDTRPIPRPLPPIHVEEKRGLDLLPRTYRLTIEDKRRGVDLVPLHRALLGMDGVRDMSLLSYSNGVAIISVEMVHELDPGVLEQAVARAMSRGAKVDVHNETTMVVKLAEE